MEEFWLFSEKEEKYENARKITVLRLTSRTLA
jgi:hypothetical protein